MRSAVERAAEPLSARLESAAAQSETFRHACGAIANWYNSYDHRKAERRRARTMPSADGWEPAGPEAPTPLSEGEATTLGCELLGECFVGGVALTVLLVQMSQDSAAEEEQNARMGTLQKALEEQTKTLQGQTERLTALEQAVERSQRRSEALEQRLLAQESRPEPSAPTPLHSWWRILSAKPGAA